MIAVSAIVLRVATLALELTRLFAWSAFSLDVLVGRTYSPTRGGVIFVLAALVTSMRRALGVRAITVLLAHAAGFAWFAYRDARTLWPGPNPLGVDAASAGSHAAAPWLILVVTWAWTLLFWGCGAAYGRRAQDYATICARFDHGLLWVFSLLLLKLLLRGQPGSGHGETISDALVLPLFLFGLLAVSLARNRNGARKRFMPAYRGLGVAVGFGAAVSIGGVAIALLVLPLRSAPASGYAGLGAVGAPIADLIGDIVLLLVWLWVVLFERNPPLLPGNASPTGAGGGSVPRVLQHLSPAQAHGLSLGIGVFGAAVLALMIAVGWRWLSRRQASGPTRAWLEWILAWLARAKARCSTLLAPNAQEEPLRLYRALLRWGRRSGLPVRGAETPLEYGRRLQRQMQPVTAEIESIVSAFNAYAYGPAIRDAASLERARRALRRLHSPRLWPARLRALWAGAP